MYGLCTILCGPKSFLTRWFYSGGGSSAGASSWKVITWDPWPTNGYDGTSEIKLIYACTIKLNCLNITIVKYLLFHIPVHNVSFITNKTNFNAGLYVNNDNIEHKSRIVTHFPHKGCTNSIDFSIYLWSIHLSYFIISPFIPLIYHVIILLTWYFYLFCFIFFFYFILYI